MLYTIGGFTPDKSLNNFLQAQTMASAVLVESRTTILATVQHNWQFISWLYIASTKEFHVKGYANVSKQDGSVSAGDRWYDQSIVVSCPRSYEQPWHAVTDRSNTHDIL